MPVAIAGYPQAGASDKAVRSGGLPLSRSAAIVTAFILGACALAFAVRPDLDLRAAHLFFGDGTFAGSGGGARLLRAVLYWLPLLVLAGMIATYAAHRAGQPVPQRFRPSGRSLLFVAVAMALGPGLLVNGYLKEQSHRPRPVQTVEFGGTSTFRPWYRFDGDCEHNCSFISGETASAAWLVAPASLLPPPLQAPAMAAAGLVTVLTGLTRMAFGGHYLSDIIFASLLTLLLVQALHGLIMPPAAAARRHGRGLRVRLPPL